MKPLHDYFYRFPGEQLHMRGRCRVRIYERKSNANIVLLTELNSNTGESIASACERIATNIAATKGLSTKTTRWIYHDPPHDDLPQVFDELLFTWDGDNKASDPQWQVLENEQAEALTGELLGALNRPMGELESPVEEEE